MKMDNYTTPQYDNDGVVMDLQLFSEEEASEQQVEVENSEAAEKTVDENPTGEEKKEVESESSSKDKKLDTNDSTAPDEYSEFSLPENVSAPIDEFKTFAKEQGLSQEKAQSLVDFYAKTILPKQEEMQTAAIEKWTGDSVKRFGKKGIETANKALSRFGSKELVGLLTDTGLGNHPEVIAVFESIGKQISESTLVNPGTKPPAVKPMYPNSKDMYE